MANSNLIHMAQFHSFIVIKRPTRDACLYMGEATPLAPLDLPDPLDPHFVFAIAPIL